MMLHPSYNHQQPQQQQQQQHYYLPHPASHNHEQRQQHRAIAAGRRAAAACTAPQPPPLPQRSQQQSPNCCSSSAATSSVVSEPISLDLATDQQYFVKEKENWRHDDQHHQQQPPKWSSRFRRFPPPRPLRRAPAAEGIVIPLDGFRTNKYSHEQLHPNELLDSSDDDDAEENDFVHRRLDRIDRHARRYSTSDLTTSDSELGRCMGGNSKPYRLGIKCPSVSTINPDDSSLSFEDLDPMIYYHQQQQHQQPTKFVGAQSHKKLSSAAASRRGAGGLRKKRVADDNGDDDGDILFVDLDDDNCATKSDAELHTAAERRRCRAPPPPPTHRHAGDRRQRQRHRRQMMEDDNGRMESPPPSRGTQSAPRTPQRHALPPALEMIEEISPILPRPADVRDDLDIPPLPMPLQLSKEWRPLQTSTLTNFHATLPKTNPRYASATKLPPIAPLEPPRSLFDPQYTAMCCGITSSSDEFKPIRPEQFNLPSVMAKAKGIRGILFLQLCVTGDSMLKVQIRNGAYFLKSLPISSFVKVEIRRSISARRRDKYAHSHHEQRRSRFCSRVTYPVSQCNTPEFYEEFTFPITRTHLEHGDKLGISVFVQHSGEEKTPELLGGMSFSLVKMIKMAQLHTTSSQQRFFHYDDHQSHLPMGDVAVKLYEGGFFLLPDKKALTTKFAQDKISIRKYYDDIGGSATMSTTASSSMGSPFRMMSEPEWHTAGARFGIGTTAGGGGGTTTNFGTHHQQHQQVVFSPAKNVPKTHHHHQLHHHLSTTALLPAASSAGAAPPASSLLALAQPLPPTTIAASCGAGAVNAGRGGGGGRESSSADADTSRYTSTSNNSSSSGARSVVDCKRTRGAAAAAVVVGGGGAGGGIDGPPPVSVTDASPPAVPPPSANTTDTTTSDFTTSSGFTTSSAGVGGDDQRMIVGLLQPTAPLPPATVPSPTLANSFSSGCAEVGGLGAEDGGGSSSSSSDEFSTSPPVVVELAAAANIVGQPRKSSLQHHFYSPMRMHRGGCGTISPQKSVPPPAQQQQALLSSPKRTNAADSRGGCGGRLPRTALAATDTVRRVASFTFSPPGGGAARAGSLQHNNYQHRSLDKQHQQHHHAMRLDKRNSVASGGGGATDKLQRKMALGPLSKTLHFLRSKLDFSMSASVLCPSREDCRLWQESFEALLGHKYGCLLFREFLLSEFSEENLDFWLQCEAFKRMKPTKKSTVQRANQIFDTFVRELAPKEVNLDSQTRLATKAALTAVPLRADMYTMAQHKIEQLMAKDSYPRFLKSDQYLELLNEQDNNNNNCNNQSIIDGSRDNLQQPSRGLLRIASAKACGGSSKSLSTGIGGGGSCSRSPSLSPQLRGGGSPRGMRWGVRRNTCAPTTTTGTTLTTVATNPMSTGGCTGGTGAVLTTTMLQIPSIAE